MECVALDVERHHLGIADFDTLFVGDGVERAFDLQAGLGGRRGNQLDHGHAIDDGAPAPDLRDVAEQAMLDLIPLRGARCTASADITNTKKVRRLAAVCSSFASAAFQRFLPD